MRLLSIFSLLMATSASVLAAGTSTTTTTTTTTAPTQTSTSCDAQNILDACKASIQKQVDACGPNDWSCLCEQTNNLLTCYNNCPNDPASFGVQQQKTSYCNAASAYSTSTTATPTATKTASSTSTTSSTESATTSATVTPSPSGGAAAGLGVAKGLGMGLVLGGVVVVGVLGL